MITKDLLTKLLIDCQLTQGQIATEVGCSVGIIVRAVKKYHLQCGRGIKHRWDFREWTAPLSYVLGAVLTDGWIRENGVHLSVTNELFAEAFKDCLQKLKLPVSRQVLTYNGSHPSNGGHLGKKDSYHITCYSSLFSRWMLDQTFNKSHIPQGMKDAPIESKLLFLAGIIDGDGRVRKDGSIEIRKCSNWLRELPDFLATMNIRGNLRLERVLDSGKEYMSVCINRRDYRSLGGTCFIPEKARRIMQGKEIRTWRRPTRVYAICPKCQSQMIARAKTCQAYYLASEELHNRLASYNCHSSA